MEYWNKPRLHALLPVVVNSHRLPANLSDTASDKQSVAGLGVYAGPAPLKSAIDLGRILQRYEVIAEGTALVSAD